MEPYYCGILSIKDSISKYLSSAIKTAYIHKSINTQINKIPIEIPPNQALGDISTPLPLIIASKEKRNPKEVAQILVKHLEETKIKEICSSFSVAGAGFINFSIQTNCWIETLKHIFDQKEKYGALNIGAGKKILVEFVSANPTGPLHIGHARGAVVGDVISNILENVGYCVEREYYINDAGNQMKILGESVFMRYKQALGQKTDLFPDYYKGSYIEDIAKEIISFSGEELLKLSHEEAVNACTIYAKNKILEDIKHSLKAFRITFQNWFSEQDMLAKNGLSPLIDQLNQSGFIYKKNGAIWLNTSKFGDEKDRVLIRSNGEPTYFASDILYHKNKIERGYNKLINLWGADHHGYVNRLKAFMKMMNIEENYIDILLIQLVNLLREGKPISMSTREGKFLSLKEVIEEVGVDATRFFLLMRNHDAPFDFDLDLAKKQSSENPVYYVQYAHARICSILAQPEISAITESELERANISLLKEKEEINLIKSLSYYPEVLKNAATHLEPHRLVFFVQELAGNFHKFYNHHRVISPDKELMKARFYLVLCTKIILLKVLNLLGITAPERM